MSQKTAEEVTQSRHYLAIRNEPKKHSSWTAECWEVVVQCLMHVTYLAHLLTVCSLASQTLWASGGSGSLDYAFLQVHSHMHWPRPNSGLGRVPTAIAHAQNVLYSDTKSKVLPRKELAQNGLSHRVRNGTQRGSCVTPEEPYTTFRLPAKGR